MISIAGAFALTSYKYRRWGEDEMKNGFVKVAAATPDIRVADVEFNTQNIINVMEEAQKNGAKILVLSLIHI